MLSDRFLVRNRNLYEKILIKLPNQIHRARPATCGSLRTTKDTMPQKQNFNRIIRRIASSRSNKRNIQKPVKQHIKMQGKAQSRTYQDRLTHNQTIYNKSNRLRLQSLAPCPQNSINVGESLEKSCNKRNLKEFCTLGEDVFEMNNFRADFTNFIDIQNSLQYDVELGERRKVNKLKKYTQNKFGRVWNAHKLVKQVFGDTLVKSVR